MLIQDKEVYGVIYKITNNVNNKVYIGQTTVGFQRRYKDGKWWRSTYNTELRKDVELYGLENFEVIEVFDCAMNKDELNRLEEYWILHYGSIYPDKGYNKTYGGNNGRPTDETRKRCSQSRSLRNRINKSKGQR